MSGSNRNGGASGGPASGGPANGGPAIGTVPRIVSIVIGNIGNANANFAAAVNNNNNDGGGGGGGIGGGAIGQNTLLNVRARLFRVLFMKIALIYAIAVPPSARRAIEWIVLSIVSLIFSMNE